MLDKRIILIIIVLGFFAIPFISAEDNLTVVEDIDSDVISLPDESSYSNIYFNASVENDGSGSQESPYKYLTSSRIKSNSILHLANGEYELDKSISFSSYNAFIGEDAENTIIKYTGMAFSNSKTLELYNLTILGAYVSTKGTLTVDNVIFRDSTQDYGGAIYSVSSTLTISNSRFINNTARLGGAICDLNSQAYIFNITAVNNTAIYQGGAIYKMYGALYLNSSEFINNSAKEGQAIFCDYSIFNMISTDFENNGVYSILCDENFTDNTFNQSELHQSDYYDINFVSQNYTQMTYIPYNGTIPSRYDLREERFVSSVKDQGSNGNCWAFAILAALESCILKATGIEYDLSEQNMKNLMAVYSDYGWDYSTNTGGTNEMAMAYLTSWIGAINETDDIYVINSVLSPVMDSFIHVQNILFLPRLSYTDNDAIKKAILNYGGVYTTLHANNELYQYYRGTGQRNHAVVIVGWDDNISKSKFRSTPPGDGAWICKNSWGTGWGDSGYFYVSYYDPTFAMVGDLEASFTFILNDTVKYDKIYQWEIAGVTDYFLTNQSTIWYKNYYNATSDDILAAFSTYFYMESNWTAEVYVNDELRLTQNGTAPARGYYTINFDEFIPVEKDDEFMILLKVTTSDEAYVPISENNGYVSRVHFKENISFISYDGIDWIDFYSYSIKMESRGHWYESQVACIKAFTIFNLTTVTLLDILSKQENNFNISATVWDQYGHLINEGYVIFEFNGVKYNRSVSNGKAILSLNALDYGNCTITAAYQNTTHYLSSSDELTFICNHDVNLTLNIEDITYGDYLKANITLMDLNSTLISANVTLTVGGKTYNVSSNSVFVIPDLINAGDCEVKVVYDGNYTYSGSVAYANVTINKADINLTLDVNNINYGDFLSINTTLSFNSTLINDELILYINNENYSFTANSVFILPVLLNASQYGICLYYNGSNNFNAKNITADVLVLKVYPVLKANISDINYGEDLIVYASLTGINGELINEGLVIAINGADYSFVANSEFILPVILNASDYTVNILYNGDINYYSVNESTDFRVLKVNPFLDVSIDDVYYGDDLIIYASLTGINDELINENVVLSINGADYSFVANSEFVLSVILNASNYTANVYYKGDSNYNSINESVNFTVLKAFPLLDIGIEDIYYGEDLIVDVSFTGINGELINENVVLSINGSDYSFVANSEFVLPVILNASNYTANVYYKGDSNYNSVNEYVNFTVNKNDVNIDFLISNITYGEVTVVNTYLTDLKGNKLNYELLLVIDSNSFEIMSNSANVLPVILNASDYAAELYFNGCENYNANNISKRFSVAKSDVNLYLSIENITYGDYLVIENALSVDLDCDLQLEIDNKSYSIKPNSSYTLTYLINAGNYEAVLSFLGNNNYNANVQKANVSVGKFTPTLISDISDIDYGDDFVVYVSLIGVNDELINESLIITINDNNYSFIANNEFILPVILNASDYTADIIYNGDINYYSANESVDFKVSKVYPTLDVSIDDVNYGDDLIVYTSLIGVNGELINESLIITINDNDYSFIANSEFILPIILNSSDYTAKITYNGDSNYNPVNKSVDFKVYKVDPILDVSINDVYYGENAVIYVSLTGINGELINETILLNINDVDYSFNSNSNFVLPVILNASNYTANVYYKGDSNYNSINESVNFTVNKNDVNIDLLISNITYGEITSINTYLTDLNGNNLTYELSLVIDNNSFKIMSNSLYALPVILNASDYTGELYFNGSENYNANYISKRFSVAKSDVILSLSIKNITYGDYLVIENTLSVDLDCDLQLEIDNKSYSIKPNSIFKLPYLINVGNYEAVLSFLGNNNYNANVQKANVGVDKFTPTLITNISDINYGDDLIVYASLIGINGELINESLVITINDIDYSFIANSEFVLPVLLNASNYAADILYNGDINYYSVNGGADFKVSKVSPVLDASIDDLIVYASLTGINGELINESLLLCINDINYSFMANSKFRIPAILNVSNYTANIFYDGDINYYSVNESVNFTVSKNYSILEVNISDINYGDDLVVYVSLTGINGELINESVVLSINGVDYSFIANSEFVLPVILNASDYAINVAYNGSLNYNSVNDSVNFTVFKVSPVLEVNVSDINYGDYLAIYTSLTGINGELINESVVLSINDVDYTFTANSVYTLPVILNASRYVVNVVYNGNDNYNAVENMVNVTVNKVNPELTLNISNMLYGNDLIVKNSLTGINGEISNESLYLTVNAKTYNLTSNVDFILPDILDVGNYTAKIIFNGNTNYNEAIDIKKFEIMPVELTMDLNISKVINNISISVKFLQKVNESVIINVNEDTYVLNTVKGEGVLTLSDLDLGNYSVEALFNKTGYETILIKDSFDVTSINTLINANNVTMYYHDGTRLYFNLTDSNGHVLANKSVKININNVTYTRTTDVNGVASLNLGLNSAIYPVILTFDGDDTYINSSSSVYVNIKSTILSNDLTKYYRNASQFYAKILDNNGNPVTNTPVLMNINGVFYNRTTNSEGVVRLNINLNPGEYILTIYNPVTGEMGSSLITVLSKLVENHDLVKYYKNASKYSVKVLDDTGSPLAGVDVTFNINGVFYTRTSDENGVASLAINLNPGKYIITAEYDTLKVSNNIEVLSVIETEDVTMTYRDGTSFKAKILDGLGNPNLGVKVTFNINGVFYSKTTDENGVASLKINLQAGEYIITSTYNGLSASNTIVIKNSNFLF